MAYSWPPDMDLRLLATGAIDLLVVGWCLAHEMRKSVAEPSPPLALGSVMSSDPVVCAQIIACTGYDNTEAKNTYSRVKSRAIPNERLVRAFEIDNAFTTSDDDRRVKFKDKARKAIKLTDAEVGVLDKKLSLFARKVPRSVLYSEVLLSKLHVLQVSAQVKSANIDVVSGKPLHKSPKSSFVRLQTHRS